MATALDRMVVPLQKVLLGIAAQPPLVGTEPVLGGLVDMRVLGERMERVTYEEVAHEEEWVISLRSRLLLMGEHFSVVDTEYVGEFDDSVVYAVEGGAKRLRPDWSFEELELNGEVFFTIGHGTFMGCDYPVKGALSVMRPGTYPDWSVDENVRTALILKAHRASTILYGGVLGNGVVVFSDYGVHQFVMQETVPQVIIGKMPALGRDSIAGDVMGYFYVGKDYGLYKVSQEGVQALGYGWLLREYDHISVRHVPVSGDVLIVGWKDGKHAGSYLYSAGLSKLSHALVDLAYSGELGLLGVDVLGKVYELNLPMGEVAQEYDWSKWNFTIPQLDESRLILQTAWSDLGASVEKSFQAVEAVVSPMWPLLVKLEVMDKTTGSINYKVNLIHPRMAVCELPLNGYRVRISLYAVEEMNTPVGLSALRLHVVRSSMEGIYAVAQSAPGKGI